MAVTKQHSIQTKLVLFFFILTIALFLSVGFLFFDNTQTIIKGAKEKELLTLVEETANKIERFVFERYGDVVVMSQSPLLRNVDSERSLKYDYLESVREAYKTYDGIFVLDQEGNATLVAGLEDRSKGYEKLIVEAKQGKVAGTDFIFLPDHKTYGLYFAAPIYDYDNAMVGTVVERMNMSAIESIVKNVHPGKAGYAYLINSSGEKLFFPEEYKTEESLDIDGQNVGVAYTDRGKNQHVAAFYRIKNYEQGNTQWYLVVEEPITEAFEVVTQLRNYTLMVVLASICILFILSIIMSQAITNPIKKLVEETKFAAEGSLRQDIKISSNDELGTLARSFNILQSNLKSMMQQVLEKSGEAASLEEIRRYADTFFENLPSAVVTIDNTERITTFNSTAAKLTGMKQEELVGQSMEKLFPDNVMPILRLLQDSLQRGVVYIKHIVEIVGASGECVPILIDTSIQKDGNGKTIGAIAIFRSLKEIQIFEESMNRAKNLTALGELSAGMAHEIRNPLTTIKGYAQYLELELADQPELVEDVTTIVHEVDRLNSIIDRFLIFARPNHPELRQEDINRLLQRILEFYKREIPDNIRVTQSYEELPAAWIDSGQIEQVILNIILNALQAMPKGGELSISTRYLEQFALAEIMIADTGLGIPPQNYDKIFEPFFTTKNKGTGLGLAICSRIVENHKGFIEVSSAPGERTKFIIRLPVEEGGEN